MHFQPREDRSGGPSSVLVKTNGSFEALASRYWPPQCVFWRGGCRNDCLCCPLLMLAILNTHILCLAWRPHSTCLPSDGYTAVWGGSVQHLPITVDTQVNILSMKQKVIEYM